MNRLFYSPIVLFLFSCSGKYNKVSEMKSGDIVSIIQGKDYCIAKILDIDTSEQYSLVSIYLYKERYKDRPDSTDYQELMNSPKSDAWGNINWEIKGLEGMKPQIFSFEEVKDEEIENDTLMNNMIETIEKMKAEILERTEDSSD